MIGMPIGPPSQRPEPKSACTAQAAPIERTIVREFCRTGRLSTRLFQTFVLGRSGRSARPGAARPPPARGERRDRAEPQAQASFTLDVSGRLRRAVSKRASFRVMTGDSSYPEGWNEVRGSLQRGYRFKDFREAIAFVDRLAQAARRRTTTPTSLSPGTRSPFAGGPTSSVHHGARRGDGEENRQARRAIRSRRA